MRKRKQEKSEPPARVAGGARPSSEARARAAGEILETARMLRQLANGNDLRLIAYLLDMVALEAADTQARLAARKRKR